MRRLLASGKAGPAFDQATQDAIDDADQLRRQEWGQWKAAAERKYGWAMQRQRKTLANASEARAATNKESNDE